jgi:peroxiredoxin
VIAFLRGGWCPPCNLELRALARLAPQLSALGARLAVVCPERPGQLSSFENVSPVAVPILEDHGSALARAFGIAQQFDDTLVEVTSLRRRSTSRAQRRCIARSAGPPRCT